MDKQNYIASERIRDEVKLNFEYSRGVSAFGKKVNSESIKLFINYIKNNPLLAFKHEVGKAIYDKLREWYPQKKIISIESRNIVRKLAKNEIVFRIRIEESESKFQKDRKTAIWAAPLDKARAGRFNIAGVRTLYLADKPQVCYYENEGPSSNDMHIILLAEYHVSEDMFLLDADALFSGLSQYLHTPNKTKEPGVYFFTNFLRDCCVEIGYSGIVYRSSEYEAIDNSGKGLNYALFGIGAHYYSKDNIVKIDEEPKNMTVADFRKKYKIKTTFRA